MASVRRGRKYRRRRETVKRSRMHSPKNFTMNRPPVVCFHDQFLDLPERIIHFAAENFLSFSPKHASPKSTSMYASRKQRRNSALRHRFSSDRDQEHKFPGVQTTDQLMESARSVSGEFLYTRPKTLNVVVVPALADTTAENQTTSPTHMQSPNFYDSTQTTTDCLSFFKQPDESFFKQPDGCSPVCLEEFKQPDECSTVCREDIPHAFTIGVSTDSTPDVSTPVRSQVEMGSDSQSSIGEISLTNMPNNTSKVLQREITKTQANIDTTMIESPKIKIEPKVEPKIEPKVEPKIEPVAIEDNERLDWGDLTGRSSKTTSPNDLEIKTEPSPGGRHDIKADFSNLSISIPPEETPEIPHILKPEAKDENAQHSRISSPKKRKASRKWESAQDKAVVATKCNCRKTKCLKLYCECFTNQQFCQEKCNCSSEKCMNTTKHVAKRKEAVRRLVKRDPLAFVPKTSTKRLCRCKRTRCQKKYCECFAAGKKCGALCKCSNCKNGGSNIKRRVLEKTSKISMNLFSAINVTRTANDFTRCVL